MMLRHVLWQANWEWQRLAGRWRGRPLALGIMALLALGAALAGALAWQAQWQRRVRLVAEGNAVPASRRMPAPEPALQRLAVFEAALPTRLDTPQLLQALLQQGQALGLHMPRGQYRWQQADAAGLAHYHMRLPVQGQAQLVERFIQEALVAHPALALQGLRLARREDGTVDAQLDWVVVIRTEAAP